MQRPLWASTGVKNPDYPDTLYVTELVAPNTVNTMPEKTLDAVADHGDITGDTVTGTAADAQARLRQARRRRHRPADVFKVLEDEGVEKFEKSWNELLDATAEQLKSLRNEPWPEPRETTGSTRCGTKRDKRMPRIAGPCGMVIFGVTGDLARKKLMPAIYDLANRGLLPAQLRAGRVRAPGLGRRGLRQDRARRRPPARPHAVPRRRCGTGSPRDCASCRAPSTTTVRSSGSPKTLAKLDDERGTGGNHAFYLSIPPERIPDGAASKLHKSRLAQPQPDRWSRVVIEKPFGHDLESAKQLNAVVNSVFPEESVFRIDHYLGKETVQNILALRFANQLFEPIWNANYVDSVQITMAEDIGLGGPGRLLRRHRRGARRDPEPPAAVAGAHRDGGAGQLPPATSCRPRRSRCSRRPG